MSDSFVGALPLVVAAVVEANLVIAEMSSGAVRVLTSFAIMEPVKVPIPPHYSCEPIKISASSSSFHELQNCPKRLPQKSFHFHHP